MQRLSRSSRAARPPGDSTRFAEVSPGLLVLLMVLLVLLVPGCSGCRGRTQAEQDKAKAEAEAEAKEKPKPDFEVDRLYIQPSDSALGRNAVKPGHYIAATQRMKANNFDFRASLETASVDRSGQLLPVDDTPFTMSMSRVAILPKGQVKNFETTYFVPRLSNRNSKTVWLQSRLIRSGREVSGSMQPTTRMPDYQFYLLALASDPDSYGYLKRLDSVSPPAAEFDDEAQILYYRVVLPKLGRDPPLPSNALAWTMIGYVLWDEVDPNLLDRDQQHAMLDWLHWGGQLIVSGPDSLDLLRGSFLEPYLPATASKAVELRQADFAELNQNWSMHVRRKNQQLTLDVLDEKPVVGVELTVVGAGRAIPGTGDLVVERQVGNGRVVVTAFPMSALNVVNWGSFDNFFNACLLRRPSRRFDVKDGVLGVQWDQSARYDAKDATLISTVRYFARDIGDLDLSLAQGDSRNARQPAGTSGPTSTSTPMSTRAPASNSPASNSPASNSPASTGAPASPSGPTIGVSLENDALAAGGPSADGGDVAENAEKSAESGVVADWEPSGAGAQGPEQGESSDRWRRGYRSWSESGVGAWNDYSGVANAVRDALKDAAGITIPKSGFVFRVLAAYLVVLVPVNWCVFRLMGRVEWAWVAAPLIAIVGAVAVVRLAQLDIGFARSRTEIATLEIQGDYPRGHLTRYSALYSSLSTSYDLEFDEPTALAQPFPAQRGQHSSHRPVHFFQEDGRMRLSGFQVDSNSTGMVHSEQMFELGGALRLLEDTSGGMQLLNDTAISLLDVGVIRRTGTGIELAWVGELDSKTSKDLTFQASPVTRFEQWDRSNTTLSPDKQVARLLREGDQNKDRVLDINEFQAATGGTPQEFYEHDLDTNSHLDYAETIGWIRRGRSGEISIGRLMDLATSQQLDLPEGDIRLVGWTDQELPGVSYRPQAAQSLVRTMVLAHLRRGDLPPPQRDVNCKVDVREEDKHEDPLESPDNP